MATDVGRSSHSNTSSLTTSRSPSPRSDGGTAGAEPVAMTALPNVIVAPSSSCNVRSSMKRARPRIRSAAGIASTPSSTKPTKRSRSRLTRSITARPSMRTAPSRRMPNAAQRVGRVRGLGGGDQELARHAAHAGARRAVRTALDQHGVLSRRGRRAVGGKAGGSGTDDGDVDGMRAHPRESSSWRRISLVSRIRIDWIFARFVMSRIMISGSFSRDLVERGARELEDDRFADRLRGRRARAPVEERRLAEQRAFGVRHDARARAAGHDDRNLDRAAGEETQPVAGIVLLEQHLAVGAIAAHEVMLDPRELAIRQAFQQRERGQRHRGMLGQAARVEDRAFRPLDGLVGIAEPQPRCGVAERVVRNQRRAVPALRRHAGEQYLRSARPEAARDALDQQRAGGVDDGDAAKVEDDDVGDAGERLDPLDQPLRAARRTARPRAR